MSILENKRILVTRSEKQNESIAQKLRDAGALPALFPCLENHLRAYTPPTKHYDWVIYTSSNAYQALPHTQVQSQNVAAVGLSTIPQGLASLIPDSTFTSFELAKRFASFVPQRILLPHGDRSSEELLHALRAQGHQVDPICVYSTQIPQHPTPFPNETLDAILFFSPSAAIHFLALTGSNAQDWKLPIACLGPTTFQAAQQLRYPNCLKSSKQSIDGIIQRLEAYFR
ncbi:MAG: uroporphyrinogen-III synthase [Myxococcaceae bacterium]|nr:uroporphyrinogen-III synthase [Myxococcaceae bacterium]MBH2006801.1 uroporphyrinogen-III synthase [Myxococcaceae bacterium]